MPFRYSWANIEKNVYDEKGNHIKILVMRKKVVCFVGYYETNVEYGIVLEIVCSDFWQIELYTISLRAKYDEDGRIRKDKSNREMAKTD